MGSRSLLVFSCSPFMEVELHKPSPGANERTIRDDFMGVSIAKGEKYTLSKTKGCADLLIWLHKRIEEKGFEVRKVSPLRDPLS